MPRFFPPAMDPRDFRMGERHTWEALAEQLPDDTTVFYSVRVPNGTSERELDFVVAWPGVGLAVLEVKGGGVGRRDDGRWYSYRGSEERELPENPMTQAGDARHALHRYLEAKGQPAARARTQHLVVLPHSPVKRDYDTSDFPRAQVVDRDQLGQLAERVRAALEKGSGFAPLHAPAVQGLVDLLVPPLGLDRLQVDAALQHDLAEQVAAEYAERLDMLSLQRRFTVVGGAGTGKTVMATEQARRLAKEGKRVALLCYSRGLGRYLTQQAAGWSKPPAYVGLFHDLALAWGAPALEGDLSVYYEETLPRALGELARGRSDLFDAVVVDEAQDFGELWWPSLMSCLKDPDQSGVYLFLDEDQRVFHRQATSPIGGEPLVLRKNFRNTKRIAQLFGSLSSDLVRPGGREGPRVRFVQASSEDAIGVADDCLDALLDVWEPGQTALLTTKNRHPVQLEYGDDHDRYWASYFDAEGPFYGTVAGFKGLERSAVVLAVNGFNEAARAREMLYVGLSRARSQLVIVGDLEEIARVGGDGVRKRLEDAERWTPG